MSAAKKKPNPLYTHTESGEVFQLVKTNPITLLPVLGSRRSFGAGRRPTKITFARDYQKVNEL